jgi:hypothetical protein
MKPKSNQEQEADLESLFVVLMHGVGRGFVQKFENLNIAYFNPLCSKLVIEEYAGIRSRASFGRR